MRRLSGGKLRPKSRSDVQQGKQDFAFPTLNELGSGVELGKSSNGRSTYLLLHGQVFRQTGHAVSWVGTSSQFEAKVRAGALDFLGGKKSSK